MPLSFPLVWKEPALIFSVVVALQICSCMLSDPSHLLTPIPLKKLVGPRSPVDVLASLCTSVSSHPAPISPRLSSPVCPVFLLHSSVCVLMYMVDTSLCYSPYLLFSHLHCLSAWNTFFFVCLSKEDEPPVWSCYSAHQPATRDFSYENLMGPQ